MPEYVERGAAIKQIGDLYEYEFPTASGAFDEFATKIVPNVLKSIPAADVAPVVHGRWRQMGDNVFECSQCGSGWLFKDGTPEEMGAKFCSYCGAKCDIKENEDA